MLDCSQGWQNERVFASPSFNKNRIVMVLLENDSPAHRNKVRFPFTMLFPVLVRGSNRLLFALVGARGCENDGG